MCKVRSYDGTRAVHVLMNVSVSDDTRFFSPKPISLGEESPKRKRMRRRVGLLATYIVVGTPLCIATCGNEPADTRGRERATRGVRF